MTGMDHELATLAQQGDLASFCPHCHAALNVYDAETRRIWVGLDVEVGDVACDLLVNPRLEEFERVCSPCWTGDAVATDVHVPALPRVAASRPRASAASASRRVFTIDVSLRTRVAPLSCCTRADCHWHGVPKRTRAKILAGAPRQKKPEQDPKLRVRNFQEVSYGYDSELAVAEASRCLQCKKPTCVDGCPVGVDIPGFVKLVAAGDFAGAARLIREKNALPAICGRVCPQDDQCEKAVPAGQEGRAARRRRARAVRRRLRARDRPGHAAAAGATRRAAASPSSAAARRGSSWPPTWPSRATASPSSRRCTAPAACSSTASRSSACPRRSWRPRPATCGTWASSSSSTASSASCTGSRSSSTSGSTPCTWPRGQACPASWACPARTSATSSPPTSTSRA